MSFGSFRMKIVVAIFSLTIFLQIGLRAQNVDSLKHVLTVVAEDTNRVNTLIELCRIYRTNAPDSSMLYGKASLELAQALHYNRGISASLNCIGAVYFFEADYKNAREYQNQALDYATRYGLTTQLANALNSLALISQYEGDYIQALDAYLRSLQIEETHGNKKGIVKVLTNMAMLYKIMGDYDNALSYSLRAFELNETLKNPERTRASIANTIGLVYLEKKNYKEALKYLQINLELGRKLNDKLMIVNGLGNIGYCYLSMNADASAAPFVEETYRMLPDITSLDKRAFVLLNLGWLRVRQHRQKDGIRFLSEALALANSTHSKGKILECYRSLAEANYLNGNFKKAYDYNDRAYKLNDSLRNTEIFEKVTNILKSYELTKKQGEIDNLSQEARLKKLEADKQRNLIYSLAVALFLVIAIAAIIYFGLHSKAKLNRTLENRNLEIQRLNLALEIKALRSQMDPHFVFNALNGLQHFLASKDAEESIRYLNMVARLIRLTLQNASRDWVKISEEVEILKLYLQVEQYRFPGKFEFEFRLESTIENEKIPFLVIQPYVENAVLHGLIPRTQPGGKLIITAKREGNALVITVEDNGVGRKASEEKTDPMFKSMGSGLVRDRLQKLSRQLDTVLQAKIEDLFDEHGNACGTRSILVFGITSR